MEVTHDSLEVGIILSNWDIRELGMFLTEAQHKNLAIHGASLETYKVCHEVEQRGQGLSTLNVLESTDPLSCSY